MNLQMHFCLRSLRQINHAVPKYCTARMQFLSQVEKKCTKLSAVALSQTSAKKPCNDDTDKVDRVEVLMIKSVLGSNKWDEKRTDKSVRNITVVGAGPCTSKCEECNYRNLLIWQNVLLGPKYSGEMPEQLIKENSNLVGVNHEMWYFANIDDACPKKNFREEVDQFSNALARSTVQCSTVQCSTVQCSTVQCSTVQCSKDDSVVERITSSGPSAEQLALVRLRLREELPSFFEGQHRYSIYSKDILFVNKLTRTTTRTLKSYKYIMKLMAYAGRLFWTKATLDIIRITKHSEDNTIKVRWTAKGMPWHLVPFFLFSGKPQSLFYRYVDGFSIFEVGRDGLIHCHRLDKVIPTSTPERQKWSVRMHVLALLGLGEIRHEPCPYEAFQVKTQEMLK